MRTKLLLFLLAGCAIHCAAQVKTPEADGRSGVLLRELQTGNADIRKAAAQNLAILGPLKPICDATEVVANRLSDDDSEVRQWSAAIMLRCMANDPGLSQKVLLHRTDIVHDLTSSNAREREMMLKLIFFLPEPLPAEFQIPLLQLLNDPDRKVRRAAIYSAQRLKPVPVEIVISLDLLVEQNDADRAYAEASLGVMKVTDSRSIEALVNSLSDQDRFVRQEAIRALWRIGRPASAAIPLLQSMANDPAYDSALRQLAEGAIHGIQ